MALKLTLEQILNEWTLIEKKGENNPIQPENEVMQQVDEIQNQFTKLVEMQSKKIRVYKNTAKIINPSFLGYLELVFDLYLEMAYQGNNQKQIDRLKNSIRQARKENKNLPDLKY